MKIVKSIVVVLSVFCIIGVILFGAFMLPMIGGLIPLNIEDSSLAELVPEGERGSLKPGSLFYYQKVDEAEISRGNLAVYVKDGKEAVGIVDSNDGATITLYGSGERILLDNVLGMRTTKNIPLIGYYIGFARNNPIVLVAFAVILVLRIVFIFYDPDTVKNKSGDTLEEALESMLTKRREEKKSASASSEVSDQKTEEMIIKETEPTTVELSIQEIFDRASTKDETVIEEPGFESIMENAENGKEASEAVIPELSEDRTSELNEEASQPTIEIPVGESNVKTINVGIAKFVAELEFDSLENSWYDAGQVDAALDEICERFDKITVEQNDEKSALALELANAKLAEDKQKINSVTSENEALKARCDALMSEVSKSKLEIENYEKEIMRYKLMEKKVANLMAQIRKQQAAGKNQ